MASAFENGVVILVLETGDFSSGILYWGMSTVKVIEGLTWPFGTSAFAARTCVMSSVFKTDDVAWLLETREFFFDIFVGAVSISRRAEPNFFDRYGNLNSFLFFDFETESFFSSSVMVADASTTTKAASTASIEEMY